MRRALRKQRSPGPMSSGISKPHAEELVLCYQSLVAQLQRQLAAAQREAAALRQQVRLVLLTAEHVMR